MSKASKTERSSVTFPAGTMKRAHEVGLNVSAVASKAVVASIKKLEYDGGCE